MWTSAKINKCAASISGGLGVIWNFIGDELVLKWVGSEELKTLCFREDDALEFLLCGD